MIMSAQEKKLMEQIALYLFLEGFEVLMEQDVIPGKSQYGKSDIIALKDNLIYAVECKFINKTNPTRKRKKVKEQALLYASILKWKHPDKIVKACTYTNEAWTIIKTMEKDEATKKTLEYFSQRLRF